MDVKINEEGSFICCNVYQIMRSKTEIEKD